MLMRLDCVLSAAVVKPRRALELEAHLARAPRRPRRTSRWRCSPPIVCVTGHEVLNLAHTAWSQESSDQNIGVREVQLLELHP